MYMCDMNMMLMDKLLISKILGAFSVRFIKINNQSSSTKYQNLYYDSTNSEVPLFRISEIYIQ